MNWINISEAAKQTGKTEHEIGLLILSGIIDERVTDYKNGGERQVDIDQINNHFKK